YGLGNPNLTAEGISIALLTTQAGLTAAFPLLILHNWLVNKKDSLINQLKLDSEDLLNRIAAKKGYSVQELLEEV
ncbi:MAG: MotA/TolQ/ExbB proton channel family protein, partial [Chitinivibrionales bacterium]